MGSSARATAIKNAELTLVARGGRREGAGRPKGRTEIAGRIRGAFVKALNDLEADGFDLSEMMKDIMRNGGALHVLKALALYVPREIRQDISHQHDITIGLDSDSAARIQRKLAQWTSPALESERPTNIARLPYSD